MRRLFIVILIFTASAGLSAADTWSIETGLNFKPGLFYNRHWDPGNSGSAASLSIETQNDKLILSAGAELGYSYTGFDLLLPISAGIVLIDTQALKFSTQTSLMPGLILSRPQPCFLFAAEINAKLRWHINTDFSLALSAGPRYTMSPGYSETVAPHNLLDMNIGMTAGFRI